MCWTMLLMGHSFDPIWIGKYSRYLDYVKIIVSLILENSREGQLKHISDRKDKNNRVYHNTVFLIFLTSFNIIIKVCFRFVTNNVWETCIFTSVFFVTPIFWHVLSQSIPFHDTVWRILSSMNEWNGLMCFICFWDIAV